MRDLGKRASKSHRDCVLPFLGRNYLPARQEREKKRGQKKKKTFFYLEISKRIEIFFGMMMMMTMLLFVFFFRWGGFFLELCFPPFMIFFRGGGAKEESGKVEDLILSIYIRQKMTAVSLAFFVCHFWKWTEGNLSAALFSFVARGWGGDRLWRERIKRRAKERQ